MDVFNKSPHLKAVLEREIVSADERAAIAVAFDFAITKGKGLLELDYERPEDASYNPRPARVALIVTSTAGVADGPVIASSILAACLESGTTTAELKSAGFESSAIELARAAVPPLDQLLKLRPQFEAAVIALSLRLDRLRHAHLAPQSTSDNLISRLFRENLSFIELAIDVSPPLYRLLNAWSDRISRRGISELEQ